METKKTEALVIGAGPGGYVATIRLGQLKKKVIMVEKEYLGGVCLNVGCIPSKALITAAKLVEKATAAEKMGISFSGVHVDFTKMQAWKSDVVKRLTTGVGQLCKGNGAEIVYGTARFRTPNLVEVETKSGTELIEAENVIVATGSRPVEIPGFPFDGQRVISSTEALSLPEIPKKLVVIGGGYIGLEMGIMYAHLGTQVTVIEMMDQLLPGFDPEVVQVINRSIRRKKITAYTKAQAKRLEKDKSGLRVIAEASGKELSLEADYVLVTVGRRPNSEGLGLEGIGVQVDRGFIRVNEKLQTNVKGVYAIGDVIGNPMLAHKAFKEGEVAAEVIAGQESILDYRAMPAVIFTDPEIATVGLSEAEAKAKGLNITVGKFPFVALGRALTTGETDGFIKIITHATSRELLGAAIVGPEASDLISELALALEMGAYAEDVGLTIHPHPTMGEGVMEAARAAIGEAIHIINK
jgi:dihydrolipoamide dehydrogenase